MVILNPNMVIYLSLQWRVKNIYIYIVLSVILDDYFNVNLEDPG